MARRIAVGPLAAAPAARRPPPPVVATTISTASPWPVHLDLGRAVATLFIVLRRQPDRPLRRLTCRRRS
jgi:hypothetical protein